jgi:hypothetical protein
MILPAVREVDPTSFSSTPNSGITLPAARELNLNSSSSSTSGSGTTVPAAREIDPTSFSSTSASGSTVPVARKLNLNPSSSLTSGSGITLSAAKELNPNSSNSSTSSSGITLPTTKEIDSNTSSSSEANGDNEFASIDKKDLVSPNAKKKATEILKTVSINKYEKNKKTTTTKITDANQNTPYEKAQYKRALANILIEHVYNADEFNKNGDGKNNTLSTLTQERFMAFDEELKGGLTNLVKDLIRPKDIKVTARDNKGKAIKDSDGNDKIIIITDDFTRYLHDNELKTAILKEITERSRYQTPNGWEKVIQQYESTNNITSSSSNADANVAPRGEESEKKKRYRVAYNTALNISQKNREGSLFEESNPYTNIPRGRNGWGDYDNVKPADQTFVKLVQATTKNDIKRYDQLNWQVMQIVKKFADNQQLTPVESKVIKDIKQWQTEGGTSKSMRNLIVREFD